MSSNNNNTTTISIVSNSHSDGLVAWGTPLSSPQSTETSFEFPSPTNLIAAVRSMTPEKAYVEEYDRTFSLATPPPVTTGRECPWAPTRRRYVTTVTRSIASDSTARVLNFNNVSPHEIRLDGVGELPTRL